MGQPVESGESIIDARVLIVDDDPHVADYTANDLRCAGVPVVATAQDAKEAIETLTSERVDIVFMDVRMPIAGPALADVVKQLFGVPVIYLTAHSGKADVQKAEAYGLINGYRIKGKDSADELLAEMRRVIHNWKFRWKTSIDLGFSVDTEFRIRDCSKVIHDALLRGEDEWRGKIISESMDSGVWTKMEKWVTHTYETKEPQSGQMQFERGQNAFEVNTMPIMLKHEVVGCRVQLLLVTQDESPLEHFKGIFGASAPEVRLDEVLQLSAPRLTKEAEVRLRIYNEFFGNCTDVIPCGPQMYGKVLPGQTAGGADGMNVELTAGDAKFVRVFPRSRLAAEGLAYAGAEFSYSVLRIGATNVSKLVNISDSKDEQLRSATSRMSSIDFDGLQSLWKEKPE